MADARYDTIGHEYSTTRHEDPQLRERIERALGESRTVVNIGAGAGSYESRERYVLPIEPSDVMAEQRPPDLAPALRLSAGPLPLRDASFDAAMAVLTIHHWDDQRETGVRELRRIARGPVVIVTYDPDAVGEMWLYRDYLPEAAALDRATFPAIGQLTDWLGGTVEVEPVLSPRDTPDWNLGSFWAHPERVLDEGARNATSAFARMEPAVLNRVVTEVGRDLADGTWERRNGALRELSEFDSGMRLLVAHP